MDSLFARLDKIIERYGKAANLIFGLTLLVIYLPVLSADFFSIDDQALISLPVFQAPLSWQTFFTLLKVGSHVDYYPVRDFSYLIDWKIFGGSLAAFHLQNLFLAFLCTVLFQRIAAALGAKPFYAFFGAWLWCFLPQHAEMFSWLSARKDILSLFFALLAVFFFLKEQKTGRACFSIFSLLAFMASILSKTAYIGLPFIGLVLYFGQIRSRKFFLVGSFLSVCFAAFYRWFYSTVHPMTYVYSWRDRLIGEASAIARMALGWFWPPLNIVNVNDYGDAGLFSVGILLVFSVVGLLFWGVIKRKKIFLLPIAIFFLAAPMPNFLSPHRFYYSVRYLEPVCVCAFLFVSTYCRIPRLVILLGLLLAIFGSIPEARIWEYPVRVSLKSYVMGPTPGAASQLWLDLENLRRRKAKVDGVDVSFLQPIVARDLAAACPLEGKIDKPSSCLHYYMVRIEDIRQRGDKKLLEDWVRRTEELLALAEDPRLPRFEAEQALLNGRADRLSKWNPSWRPNEQYRYLYWAALCAQKNVEEARTYGREMNRRLLLGKDALVNVADKMAHSSLRSQLGACLP